MSSSLYQIKKLQDYKESIKNEQYIQDVTNGKLYKAIYKNKKRIAIVKLSLESQDQLQNFQEEIEKIINLNHQNIIKTYFGFFDNEEQTFFIGMDYFKNNFFRYLEKKSKTGIKTQQQIFKWGRQLTEVLNYLKNQNTSLKRLIPDSIFIDDYGSIKLHILNIIETNEISSQKLLNLENDTKLYMSPELFEANDSQMKIKEIDLFKSNIYSLGLIILQISLNLSNEIICKFSNQDTQQEIDNILEKNKDQLGEQLLWLLQKCLKNSHWIRSNLEDLMDFFNIKSNQFNALQQEIIKLKEENIFLKKNYQELLIQNQNLLSDLETFKVSKQSFQIHYQQEDQTVDQILEKIYDLNCFPWKHYSQDQRKSEMQINSGLEWDASSSSSYYWNWGNYWGDWEYYFTEWIVESDREKAQLLLKQLHQATGFAEEQCLKIIHSTLWNIEKAKKSLKKLKLS